MATKKENALDLFNWWMPVDSPAQKWDEQRKLSFLFDTPSQEFDPMIRRIEAGAKIWEKEQCGGMEAAQKSGMVWCNTKHKFIRVEESF